MSYSYDPFLDFNVYATARFGYLEFGANGRLSMLLSENNLAGGGLLGLHVGDRWSLRVFAAGGVHRYTAVGYRSSFFGQGGRPGQEVSLAYAGAHLIGGHSFGRRRNLFLGLALFWEQDLERVWVEPGEDFSPVQAGWFQLGATVVMGYQHLLK